MSTVITLPTEPVLDGVKPEDRTTVRDVIYLLHALKLCCSWSVHPSEHKQLKGYEVTGLLDSKKDAEISLEDLELVKKVDPRVIFVGVCYNAGIGNFTVKVRVLCKSEPLYLEETDILRIQKKRKWFPFL